jgi:hypothetical protein
MEQRTSTLRLRRIRFKDGRAPIEVIRKRSLQEERAQVLADIGRVLDVHIQGESSDIAGFAFVVWSHDTASTATLRCYDNGVACVLVPEFVKERLRHEITEKWTRAALKDEGAI